MEHTAVLNIRALANPDFENISTHNAIVPDRAFRPDHNIANDCASRSNESAFMHLRCLAVDRDDIHSRKTRISQAHSYSSNS